MVVYIYIYGPSGFERSLPVVEEARSRRLCLRAQGLELWALCDGLEAFG